MNETQPPNTAPSPKRYTVILALHGVQLLLALIILGLDAYAVRYLAYSVLVYSLVVTICTIVICTYLIISRTLLLGLYSHYLAVIYHGWMIVFWSINLGLVAHLAHIWERPVCTGDVEYVDGCETFDKMRRSLQIGGTTSYKAFYKGLVIGGVGSGVEVLLWVTSTLLISLPHLHLHPHLRPRTNTHSTSNSASLPYTPPPTLPPAAYIPSTPVFDTIPLSPPDPLPLYTHPNIATGYYTPPTSSMQSIWPATTPSRASNRSVPQPLIPGDSDTSGSNTPARKISLGRKDVPWAEFKACGEGELVGLEGWHGERKKEGGGGE